jgi:uncharacterized membrane protein
MKARVLAIAVLAFLGMVDALYLSLHRGAVPCTLTGGCNEVLTSRYSSVAGIPLPWIGLGFYLTVFSSAVFEASGAGNPLRWIFWLSLAGFCISLVLVGLQAFVIHAFCEYCLGSAVLVTSIFGVSAWSRVAQQ